MEREKPGVAHACGSGTVRALRRMKPKTRAKEPASDRRFQLGDPARHAFIDTGALVSRSRKDRVGSHQRAEPAHRWRAFLTGRVGNRVGQIVALQAAPNQRIHRFPEKALDQAGCLNRAGGQGFSWPTQRATYGRHGGDEDSQAACRLLVVQNRPPVTHVLALVCPMHGRHESLSGEQLQHEPRDPPPISKRRTTAQVAVAVAVAQRFHTVGLTKSILRAKKIDRVRYGKRQGGNAMRM